jgi:hypothetical protein
VTVAYFLRALGNVLIRLALFAFGLSRTLPYLVISYTHFGGVQLFLINTLESLAYCFQPILGSWHFPARDEDIACRLSERLNQHDSNNYASHCCAFFGALFNTLPEHLTELKKGTNNVVKRWNDHMCSVKKENIYCQRFKEMQSKFDDVSLYCLVLCFFHLVNLTAASSSNSLAQALLQHKQGHSGDKDMQLSHT